jgi:hypothetical protein
MIKEDERTIETVRIITSHLGYLLNANKFIPNIQENYSDFKGRWVTESKAEKGSTQRSIPLPFIEIIGSKTSPVAAKSFWGGV